MGWVAQPAISIIPNGLISKYLGLVYAAILMISTNLGFLGQGSYNASDPRYILEMYVKAFDLDGKCLEPHIVVRLLMSL